MGRNDDNKSKRSDYGPKRRGRPGQQKIQKKDDVKEAVDMSSPIMQAFSVFQEELDRKHDKYERIVKLSRDLTIESKRILFLLHRITGESNKNDIITQAAEKLTNLQTSLLSKIAEELLTENPAQFLHAFTAGLQEYIEAVAFFVYVKSERLVSREELSEQYLRLLKTPIEEKVDTSEETQSPTEESPVSIVTEESTAENEEAPLTLYIPPLEFFLGLADFTGELMRLCVNSIGDGDLQLPYHAVDFLRQVYDGFQLIGNQSGREMSRKVRTLRQSLWKVENVCYTLQVRGSEIPKHMLLDAIQTSGKDGSGLADATE